MKLDYPPLSERVPEKVKANPELARLMAIKAEYEVPGFPTVFYYDASGKQRAKLTGYNGETTKELPIGNWIFSGIGSGRGFLRTKRGGLLSGEVKADSTSPTLHCGSTAPRGTSYLKSRHSRPARILGPIRPLSFARTRRAAEAGTGGRVIKPAWGRVVSREFTGDYDLPIHDSRPDPIRPPPRRQGASESVSSL